VPHKPGERSTASELSYLNQWIVPTVRPNLAAFRVVELALWNRRTRLADRQVGRRAGWADSGPHTPARAGAGAALGEVAENVVR
jgi:hypothetical protein